MRPTPFTDRAVRIVRGPAVIAGAIAFFGTMFYILVLLPATLDLLEALSVAVAFGVTLLATTAIRVIAGVMGARHLRRNRGTEGRGEAIPSVLVGVAVAWAVYIGLALLAGADDLSFLRVVGELLRWSAEAALGAFVVSPGPVEEPDPRLRRFMLSGRGR